MSELIKLQALLEMAYEAGYLEGSGDSLAFSKFEEWFATLDVGKVLTAITELPQPLPEQPVVELEPGKRFMGMTGTTEREYVTRWITYDSGRIEVTLQDLKSYERDHTVGPI